jgi:hypothetical protein
MRGYHEDVDDFVRRKTFLVHAVQLLHYHCSCCTATIANGSHTILTRLELVEEGDKDTRTRATQSMAQGDGTAQHVDLGVLETEDLVGKS